MRALTHYGTKGMKWGVRKDKLSLNTFQLSIRNVNLSGTQGTTYTWLNKKKQVAQFTTFDWWDGKNIENLKVYDGYKGQGLSYQLLDYATKKLGCKSLAVKKDNKIAKHVYDKYGFKVSEEDADTYYMQLDEDVITHFGILGEHLWRTELSKKELNLAIGKHYIEQLLQK